MYVEDKKTGERFEVKIERVKKRDFAKIKKNAKFAFDWDKYKKGEVYKLILEGSQNVLGLMHLIDHPEAGYDFLEVDVIEIDCDHQGRGKGLGRIGGCLLGYAAQLSDAYGHDGFLFLVAKNEKAPLFHKKYGFEYIGKIGVLGERMMSDTSNSVKLVKEYIDKSISNETQGI